MSRLIGRLTALKVAHARTPGMYADGDGLYLQVTSASARSWIFRYRRNGKHHEMGLGTLKIVTLAEAREKALNCRRQIADGLDPLAARKGDRARLAVNDARTMSFDQCAAAFIKAHAGSWKSAVHHLQWETTLATYVSPVFGSLPVAAVDVGLVMRALEPIWTTKPETAGRIRGRIESVLNWAKARGYRSGENPAAWKGHLENLLPARSKLKTVKHHVALPYDQIAKFMDTLHLQDGMAARALEFAILTAGRTGEIIGARWNEIDLSAKIWCVPASRMKSNREHRVPLSDQALAVLQQLKAGSPDDYVFAGRTGGPLSNMSMLMLLRRMGHPTLTSHGFRSSFRDWAAELTNTQAEVAEAALGRATTPGRLADGDGLYLQITSATARSWIFQYSRLGKSHEMGLGTLKVVGLAGARARAQECRRLLSEGIDPIAARKAEFTRIRYRWGGVFRCLLCATSRHAAHARRCGSPHSRLSSTMRRKKTPDASTDCRGLRRGS